ncbi:MAG: queuine tRNA-ribosyltransferase [Legionella sp.]|nr:queuine tRNA-ribosyltransferase [Legionella sp.]
MNIVPVATTPAALCLSMANWVELNVGALVFSLESLLIKPGYELLKTISDIRLYLGWSGSFILSAQHIKLTRDNTVTLISPYDGSKLLLTEKNLVDILNLLRPDVLILPKKCELLRIELDASILTYIHVNDVSSDLNRTTQRLYFDVDDKDEFAQLCDYMEQTKPHPCYITGKCAVEVATHIKTIKNNPHLIESDKPANEAMQGRVYTQSGVIDILDNQYELSFEPIDPNCTCPTCAHQLTKAYLHHLLVHTPLLCQRFLIQHNVYYVKTYF